ncbi:S-adenosyl-L-methionine-dependent methyltransferase, partial [Coprinellus micaceus]
MSTFAKATFNASSYSSGRPTYPDRLYGEISRFYKRQPKGCVARWERMADIGCGTGQATSHFKGAFDEIVCVDPSAGMLSKARDFLFKAQPSQLAHSPSETPKATQFTFAQGYGEDLRTAIPEDGSIDVLISAQACHWFDWSKVWPETRRVLRPKGGIAAFWVYGEMGLTAHTSLAPTIERFWQGTDKDSKSSIGAYFERPGRTVLERLLTDVPAPKDVLGNESGLEDFSRVFLVSDPKSIPVDPEPTCPVSIHAPTPMRTSWRWIDLLSYMRTASALHSYHERFPEDLQAPDDIRFLEQDLADISARLIAVKGGDVAVRFWKDLREGVAKEISGGVGLFDRVTVEWPVAMLLVRR